MISRLQARERGFSGIKRLDVIAEPPRHRLEQSALDWIVIDNEDQGSHNYPGAPAVRRDATRHSRTSR